MKIVNNNAVPRYGRYLHEVKPGQCVEFARAFHSKHADTAKFIVMRVPAEYIVEQKRYKDGEYRIMVANLATGDTSLVLADRRVRIVDAQVVLLNE